MRIIVAVLCVLGLAGCDAGKYAKKSKTSESQVMLQKLAKGAKVYFLEERPAGGIVPIPPQFPNSVGPTPEAGACCRSGGKCAPDASLWADPSWDALRFSLDDPHYYSYQFTSEGTGPGAKFTAAAYGDLDCDGVFSTFELTGMVTPDGDVAIAAGLVKNNELE